MAVQVNPIVARKGIFMKSFPEQQTGEMDEMFGYIAAAEAALETNKISGQRIVYTKIPRWSGPRRFDMFEVYVIPTGLVKPGDEKIDRKYKVKKR